MYFDRQLYRASHKHNHASWSLFTSVLRCRTYGYHGMCRCHLQLARCGSARNSQTGVVGQVAEAGRRAEIQLHARLKSPVSWLGFPTEVDRVGLLYDSAAAFFFCPVRMMGGMVKEECICNDAVFQP
jgi:hypothetical protein